MKGSPHMADAPNQPTPGEVLNGESVRLLLPGDVLRRADGSVGPFLRLSISGLVIWNPYREKRDPHEILAFLGRPDADGWIEWHGGEKPALGIELKVRMRDEFECVAHEGTRWVHYGTPTAADIIAYRIIQQPRS